MVEEVLLRGQCRRLELRASFLRKALEYESVTQILTDIILRPQDKRLKWCAMDTIEAEAAKCVLCYFLQGCTYLVTRASLH